MLRIFFTDQYLFAYYLKYIFAILSTTSTQLKLSNLYSLKVYGLDIVLLIHENKNIDL